MNERDFRVCEQNPEFEMQIIQNKFCLIIMTSFVAACIKYYQSHMSAVS